MANNVLTSCLEAIPVPAGVEEWLQPSASVPPLPSNSEYQRGVYDTLAALGVLTDRGELASPMAYYFIRSLGASLADNALDAAAWQGTAHEDCAGTGAQLVRLLESHRLACCDDPTPLRIVRAVTAVIKARRGSENVYLMQYDSKARQFQPIGGKQESFDVDSLAALTRELGEELNLASLQAGIDFKAHPLKENIRVDEVSASTNVITRYDHSFYHLTDIRFALAIDELADVTRWLSEAELAAHQTTDGLAVTALFDEQLPGVLQTLAYSVTDNY